MSLNFTNKIFSIGGEGTPTLQFCKGGFIIGDKQDAPSQAGWQVPEQTNLTHDDAQAIFTAFGNNKYVAINQDGDASTSADGITWSEVAETALVGDASWSSITYGNNKFVAVGMDGSSDLPVMYVSTSTNGTTWTTPAVVYQMFLQIDPQTPIALTYTGQQFVILGALVDLETQTANWAISTSTDGMTWTTPALTNLIFDFSNPTAWYGLVYGNRKYVAVGSGLNRTPYISTSTDGVTWTTPQNILSSLAMSLVYDNDNFILLFADGTNYCSITSTDGITWTTPVIETNLGDTDIFTPILPQTFNNANFVYPMLNNDDDYWYITTYQN